MKQDRFPFVAADSQTRPQAIAPGSGQARLRWLHPFRRVAQSPLSWVGAGLVLLLLVVAVLDLPVRRYAVGLDPDLHPLMRAMTQIGNSAWSLSAGLLIWLVARLTRGGAVGRDATALRRVETVALFVVSSVALSGVIANLAKNIIGRARPMTEQGGVFDFAPLTFHHSWASFPSGHATTALAFATCLAMIWPRHAVGWLACGVFVALTRAFIGAHWMSDVVAGAVLGVLVPVVLWPRFCRRPLRPLLPPRTLRLAAKAVGQAAQRLVAAAPASLTDVLDWRRQD